MSDERSRDDLLHQLRIDRAQRDDDESRPRWPWVVGIAIAIVIIVGVVAAFALRGRAATVETSTAVAAASGNDAAVLQATGYVVARREATISAQIIGTLTQVSVEEGDHVEQGQILAKLDPTAYQAQLNSAQAQYAAAQAAVVKARAMLVQDRANASRMNDVVDRGYVSRQAAEQANTQVATDAAALDVAIKQAQAAKDQVQAAQVNLDFTVIRAPFSGVVTA
ncbi:MAG TPA: biotin/lipoyl-binding protein, partial [Rhodanobacteraceae bacterium]|nr:biotin/lipoyl-binding protein [Rhodanobacteraceae bacterium]